MLFLRRSLELEGVSEDGLSLSPVFWLPVVRAVSWVVSCHKAGLSRTGMTVQVFRFPAQVF